MLFMWIPSQPRMCLKCNTMCGCEDVNINNYVQFLELIHFWHLRYFWWWWSSRFI